MQTDGATATDASRVHRPQPTAQAPLNPLATPGASTAGVGIGSGAVATGPKSTVEVASADDDSPSSLRVALLAMGFLAAAVLVGIGLFKLTAQDPVTNVDADGRRLQLPALVEIPAADAAEPTIEIADRARAILADLEKGGALLFFANPATAEGIDTAEIAVEMHRRLRGHEGLRVALVVPQLPGRSPVGTSAPGAPDVTVAAVRAQLRGVTSDLLVLVDPADESNKPGLWRRTRFDVPEDNAAVLVEDGLLSMRVSPPAASMPLTRSHVAPLVREAVARHAESAAPSEPPVDDDPAAMEDGHSVDDLRKKPATPPK